MACGIHIDSQFDRGGTNQLWVGDVGQGAIEEVDNVVSGGNYGWRVYGDSMYKSETDAMFHWSKSDHTVPPVFQYTRVLDASGQNRCSVTGGYVYRGRQNALPVGSYIYADYCTGEIMLWNGAQQSILSGTHRITISSRSVKTKTASYMSFGNTRILRPTAGR